MHPPEPSSTDRTRRARLVVAIILALGWTVSGVVWIRTPAAVENDDIYDMEHSKKYLRQLERIGGKSVVLTSELNDWVASLWEGRNRAYTLAVLTAAVAGGYVLLRRPEGR